MRRRFPACTVTFGPSDAGRGRSVTWLVRAQRWLPTGCRGSFGGDAFAGTWGEDVRGFAVFAQTAPSGVA